jgi:hypothetical protein
MENLIYSAVIGTVLYTYIQLFNRNMNLYKESDYTLTWGQFIDGTAS